MEKKFIVAFVVLCTLLSACEEYTPTPKKFGFHRIDLPTQAERSYKSLSVASCPFEFEYPNIGEITRSMPDSCWTDIQMGPYDLKWHITYRDVKQTGKDISTHFEEYRKLIYKHTKKATRIEETPLTGPAGSGTFFEIYGNVGTPAQVFYADAKQEQVMMMSIYFQTALRNDSLKPVIDYMKEEVQHAVETLQWKK
ncbi:MAG: hypothetical protein MRZ79_13320 [Bacteroidia bacterium]|nr:hypothetical protein [Bacteroidia bacterium]